MDLIISYFNFISTTIKKIIIITLKIVVNFNYNYSMSMRKGRLHKLVKLSIRYEISFGDYLFGITAVVLSAYHHYYISL